MRSYKRGDIEQQYGMKDNNHCAAKEALEKIVKSMRRKNYYWWSEEMAGLVEQKKSAYQKWLLSADHFDKIEKLI